METNISRFLKEKEMSESTRKSYITLFRNIEAHETTINRTIEDWSKEDCLNMLSSLDCRKYNTLAVKWSLLKKYLIFIGNKTYRDINKNDLLDIENGTLRYIPYEEVIMGVNVFENYLDKAIVLLLRNGLKGEEIINIKMDDINVEKNEIKLEDKKIILDDYTMGIIDKASKERGYKMYVKEKSNYDYYYYNESNPYLWKNRKNKFNNDGLDRIKENAGRDKINRILRRIDVEGISTTSLYNSYVADKIKNFELETGIELSEKQIKGLLNNMNIKANVYSVYNLKRKI